MKLIYKIEEKPPIAKVLVFAMQQILAVMSATIAVPLIVGNGLTPQAAMFGAGAGTLTYLAFTKMQSPVVVSSSFAYIGSMLAAFAGGVSMQLGFLGIILGAMCTGIVYVVIAIIVKCVGTNWIDKFIPPVVIGPTVAIIGLSLAGNAGGDLVKLNNNVSFSFISLLIGIITIFITMYISVYSKKSLKLIPFFIAILISYIICVILTLIGKSTNNDALLISDIDAYSRYMFPDGKFTLASIFQVPRFVFQDALLGIKEMTPEYFLKIFMAYTPVAFVTFSEHLADHKNLSTIVNKELLNEPGMHRTLCGDGIGSIVGAIFGGCPNTTYGESVACVALTGNASAITILVTAILCIILSFFTPFVAFVNSIPPCVMGGVCVLLYGFIAVSGLKMIQQVDLSDNANLFVVSIILILGIGGREISIGAITLTKVAVALIMGIIANVFLHRKDYIGKKSNEADAKGMLDFK